MADNTPRFDQQTLANQSGVNVSRVNNLSRVVDAFLAGARVKDRDLLTPPGGAAEGDLYLLPATGTLLSGWSTFTNGSFALYLNAAWLEITVDAAMEGVRIRVVDENVSLTYADGDGWVETQQSVEVGIVAAGTTQGGATALTAKFSEVATTTGSDDAVVLPAARVGDVRIVKNEDSTEAAQVFPASGDAIDALATDASYSLAAGDIATFYAISAAKWYSFLGA